MASSRRSACRRVGPRPSTRSPLAPVAVVAGVGCRRLRCGLWRLSRHLLRLHVPWCISQRPLAPRVRIRSLRLLPLTVSSLCLLSAFFRFCCGDGCTLPRRRWFRRRRRCRCRRRCPCPESCRRRCRRWCWDSAGARGAGCGVGCGVGCGTGRTPPARTRHLAAAKLEFHTALSNRLHHFLWVEPPKPPLQVRHGMGAAESVSESAAASAGRRNTA